MFLLNDRIKEERKRLGLTQVQLAELTGVTVQSQRAYESGKRKPDSEYLAKAGEAGCDVYYILVGRKESEPQSMLLTQDELEWVDNYRALNKDDQKLVQLHLQAVLNRAIETGSAVTVRKRDE